MQQIIEANNNYEQLDEILKKINQKKLFLVCDSSIGFLTIGKYFDSLEERLGIRVIRFSDFKPNPLYDSVTAGVRLLNDEGCRLIAAVGGGSAMDVAKCIKLYADMNHSESYLTQKIAVNDIILMAVPTTAGTGSEATRFAVIYHNGEKQSVADESCIPSIVVIDPTVLETLPEYQKKSTMLDALCHATESFWSVNSTEESQQLSAEAIGLIMQHYHGYIANDKDGNACMLKAANIAGKAINITQTTAGHAMCYKLTSLYGISHGHSAALCVSKLFPYMAEHTDKCIDPRGREYLEVSMAKLAAAYGCDTAEQAAEKFNHLLQQLELSVPTPQTGDYEVLRNSVNVERLKNNPVALDSETIDKLYHQILAQ